MIFIFCLHCADSQVLPDLKFSHLTDKDGLSNDNVLGITQDKEGVIWVGTENGLNRFDGYGFKNFYANANDPKSIPNSFISEIIPDQKNNLWISTSEGIFYFNTKTQTSSVFKSDPPDTATFRDQHRPFIYLDSSQLPWVTTYDGIYHFKDSIHYERTDKGITAYSDITKKNSKVYAEFIKDRTGQLWCCWENQIFRVSDLTKKVERIYKFPCPIIIRRIFFDSYNRCWVSTWGKGIYLFSPEQNKWQPFHPSKTRTVIFGTVEWKINGRKLLVFSCSSPGLFFVDEDDFHTYSYFFDKTRVALRGLPFVDTQNILWISTSDGIYYIAPSNNLFRIIPVPPLKNKQGQNMIAAVYNMKEEKSGYWISKRYNGGILWYDKNWRLLHSWPQIPVGPGKKYSGMGSTIQEGFDFKQLDDDMFITTESGISILNLHTLKWEAYTASDVKSPPRLRTIIAENERTWWIRSFDQGIFIFNPVTKQFIKHYRNDKTGMEGLPSHINYLLRDKKQRTFVSTNDGLFQFNNEKDDFEKLEFKEGPIPSATLLGLAEDIDGWIWIGAENGLFAFNPNTHKIERTFSENNKIGIVFRICSDDDQNIWFSSNSGYWCWLRKPDKMIHFGYGLGLPKTDEGIFYKTLDGSVYGGGEDAVIRFYPDRLIKYTVTAKTSIMEAVINDTLTPFATEASGQKKLTLSPDESSINIDFDVINYDLISNNQYFYKLSPGDKGWQQSESGHLSFYNLQPGTYRLEVKGASKLTGNFTNTDSLDILIRPFWYQSDWIKLILLIIAGLLILYFARYRIKMVRKEASFRQKMAETEMTALRTQMNPHFIFNSLNSIENFIMQNEKRLASDYLNKFARLIRMILENSRKQAVPLNKDMEAMKLYVDLEQLRFNNKFSYITDIDKILLDGDYRVPPLLIQPFVENAIVHGLAPSDRKNLVLKISARLYDDYIQYTVEDNGIGRVKSLVYTEQNKTGHKSLGLQITRERIEILNREKEADAMLEIIDLYDVGHAASGTRVVLTLKAS